jgi:iron complex transport system substrate-binding protein
MTWIYRFIPLMAAAFVFISTLKTKFNSRRQLAMKNKTLILLLVLIISILTTACGSKPANTTSTNTGDAQAAAADVSSETVTITHKLGSTEVSVNPAKIVVFDFGILDSLDKLGVAVTGVPQPNVPSYLEKYKDKAYTSVGSLMEPDFEAISAIEPDLIIISARQAEAYEEFKKLGPTVFMGLDSSKYMESFEQNMNTLGTIFDKQEEVKAEVDAVKAAIETVKGKASAAGNGLVVLTSGGKVSAYGPGSRFGIIHDVLGLTPADPGIEVSTHGMSVSFEYIAEKNPDYLFVVDRDAVTGDGGASAKEVIENDLVKNTRAYKDGHIVYLNPDYWYLSGGGLQSVPAMAEEVSQGLK